MLPLHLHFKQLGVLLALSALVGGCDLPKLTADSTAGLFDRAAPAFEEHWDYDLAGDAAPATIVQLEGILRIVPDNKLILLQLVRAYSGYSYGWIELEAERLEFEGEYEAADEARRRSKILYLRAKDLAQHLVNVSSADDAYAASSGAIEDTEKFLRKNFETKEDAEVLLWAGYAWGSYINAAKDDMAAVADLDYAKAYVARSIALDGDYYHAAGDTFMGVATAAALAADLDKAKEYFERAMARTNRRALLTQVNMARHYAVKTGDRELFDKLLNEVLEASDTLPEARLANRIARVRAQLYLDHADELF